jgi:hypothetical protein
MTNQSALALKVVMHGNQPWRTAIGLAQIRPDQSEGLCRITDHYRRAMKWSTLQIVKCIINFELKKMQATSQSPQLDAGSFNHSSH